MRHSILLLLNALLLFLGCQKELMPPSPTDASRIEGHWRSMLPEHPDWEFHFDRGLLTQSLHDFGAPLVTHQFPYTTRQDTAIIGGNDTNPQRIWVVYFHCDSIAEVRNATPGQILQPVVWLKRR